MKNPLAHYLHSRLQRRLFWTFGLAILMTGATVATVMSLMNEVSSPTWRRSWQGGLRFVAARFEPLWNDPASRAALAAELSRELRMEVSLLEGPGPHAKAPEHCHGPRMELPVGPPTAPVGAIRICDREHGPAHLWRMLLAVGIALVMLWAASGRMARRLARPLTELARVAKELGTGQLSSRVIVRHRDYEIRAVGEAMNEMASRIERQLADQRELLAAVSHELRTPLSRIRLITELARTSGATPKALDDLDQEVTEIDDLVGQLLASARIDFQALTLTDLDATELARRSLERTGERAELLASSGPVFLRADATLIGRALANLLENARRHAGGATCLKVTSRDGRVGFEVEDKGDGFGPGEELEAFKAFYRRPRNGEGEVRSLGLGLALVRRIADAHGGIAYARNLPGGGAVVGLELPAAPAA